MDEYVGLDVSKEETSYCVMSGDGVVVARGKALSDPDALVSALGRHCACPARVVLETGTLSAWLARELRSRGLPVSVVDARQAHAVLRLQRNKTDAGDAEQLAGLARSGFFHAVSVRSEAGQVDRLMLKARSLLVRQRRDAENAIRGLLGSLGIRFAKGKALLTHRVSAALEGRPDLREMIEPLLSVVAHLKREIARLDDTVSARAKADDAVRLLMSAPGIGPVTALAFAATIDDAGRFRHSRAVGAYVGLTARRFQSGEMDWSGRISKRGDTMLRSLLYEAAGVFLTVVRKAHPLKDWARRIARRSGQRKARVALARKMAVILHRMLVTGEAFRWPEPRKPATA
ncbi:MAG: IS110 family transposase [Proteobacteria bacterium]|nr:IS110 family transposase [Pseudomonadota bacterium]